MAPRGRLPLLLVAVVLAQVGATSCGTLRGSVACLDCAPGHHLSGVVVAVKCRGGGAGGGEGQLHAAQTDGRGGFEVAVATASRCAARVLGGAEQLCAPQVLAVARVVRAGKERGLYALGSPLAVVTRCSGALAATAAAGGGGQRPPPSPPQQTPARSPPPYDLGLPLIYFFPFIPIIGIP